MRARHGTVIGLAGLAAILGAVALASLVGGAGADGVLPEHAPASAERARESVALAAPSTAAEGAPDARVSEVPASTAPAVAASAPRERRSLARELPLAVRVVDLESGAPVAGLRPLARVDGESDPRLGPPSDAEGSSELRLPCGLGATVGLVRDPDWVAADREQRVVGAAPPASNTELVVHASRWPPPPAGDVTGVLLSERGAWTAEGAAEAALTTLDLVSLAEPRAPRVELRTRPEVVPVEGGAPLVRFAFRDVPRGEYELTLSNLDAFVWTPERVFVAPPAERLEFLRYDREDALPLAFRVLDARTGEPLERFDTARLKVVTSRENGVLLNVGPLELGAVPEHARFRWALWAPGYAPAFGDETAFVREGERRVAEVRLRAGWGLRVLVLGRAPTMRPVHGAELVLDGVSQGFSDSTGFVDGFAESEPELAEVRYRGWNARPGGGLLSLVGGLLRPYREPVAVVVVEPPADASSDG